MSSSVGNGAQVVPITKTVARENSLTEPSDPVAYEAGRWTRVFTTEGVHPFDQVEWKRVTAEITRPNGEVVFRQENIEVPAWWNQNTINVVADKYFRVINGVKEDSVKKMFSRVCSTIRQWAQEQNYFNSPLDAQVFEEELAYALVHQYGAFNSPVWFNLGVPGRKQAASACFISGVNDSLDEIMDFQKAEVTIFRAGSGSGANLSNLRSSHEKIAAGSYTSGPMSWMQGLNAYAGAMKSGGATRNAAKMVVLDMDHPDVLETRDGRPGFISCKEWAEKLAHDLVNIGYSADYDDANSVYKIVPYQNANHSVSVPDAFMQAMIDDGSWSTKERHSGKTVTTYRARYLWERIAKAAWVCGDPGVQFTDTINKWHTTPKSGRIRASNPCSEFLHVDNTACNLCAVNLTKFFDGQSWNRDRFAQAVRVFSTSQMAIIAKADYPTKEIEENSHKLRPIGTNYGDLGALVMNMGYGYDSDEGRAIAARMASLMTGMAYLTSAKLAARVGAFSEFEKNRDDMLRVMKMHQEADSKIIERWHLESDPLGDDVVSTSAEVWKQVIALGEKHGYSISQATLQAPLGTISFLMGMSTTGIEPAFSLVSYKKLVGGGFMKIVNSGVRQALTNLGYSQDQVDSICKYIEDNDTIEGAPGLELEHLPVFDCAMPTTEGGRYLSPMAHIKMMAAIQPLITCAMSKTVNLPKTVTEHEIASIYQESWRLGLKCVALYRDGCKASQPLATKKTAEEQAKISDGASRAEVAELQQEVARLTEKLRNSGIDGAVKEVIKEVRVPVTRREKMPSDVTGWRHKFEIDGYKGYLQVNEFADGRPGEIFLKLGKPGSTVAGLIDGFTQLCSLGLQYGIPLPKLIQSFIDTRFEPSGMTKNRKVQFTKSIFDYMFKMLDVHYYDGKYSGLHDRLVEMGYVGEQVPDSEVQQGISKDVPAEKFDSSPAPAVAAPADPVRARKSLDAPPCSKCGHITQRNGSCYLCSSCGTTTGCS